MQFLKKLIKKEETETVTVGDWFTSKEHYLEFIAEFKKSANDPKVYLSSTHFLLYAILRNKDWKKGWTTPLKPGKKVEHSVKLSGAFNNIKSPYREDWLLKPFGGTITTDMLMTLRENLQDIRNS